LSYGDSSIFAGTFLSYCGSLNSNVLIVGVFDKGCLCLLMNLFTFQVERDRENREIMRKELEHEAKIMKDVPDWIVGEKIYSKYN
jgi:hypothetical protein